MQTVSTRLYCGFVLVAALVLAMATPARAQYKPRPLNDPATGEQFHIEAAASFWSPGADLTVTSGGSGALSGIAGTEIDAKRDLGFTDKRMPSLEVFLQPAAGHKFRLQYIPIKFEASSTVSRDIVFNGQRYRIGIPVDSTLRRTSKPRSSDT